MGAPVIVFAYNRPDHLNKTLRALSENRGAADTEVYVFIDGPKQESGRQRQDEVKQIALSFEPCFRSLTVRAAESNRGLAKSIIGGVTEVMDRYTRVIVVEDDAVSAPGFLSFMNEALTFYENDPAVWSIGGYTVPIQLPDDYSYDVIKTQRSSSYAWATWKDRWDRVDWDVSDYGTFKTDFKCRKAFNRWGSDRSLLLDEQMNGRVNSWAIRFDYAMFRNGMYNIIPRRSLIANIGHDGSGTNAKDKKAEEDPFTVDLGRAPLSVRPAKVEVDERIRRAFCVPFTVGRGYRLKRYIINRM